MRTFLGLTVSLFGLMAATPALAQDTDPPKALTLTGSAAVVSDYRFRGISQSNKDFAVQGSLTLTHESGFYATVWASSVDGYVVASNTGDAEIDLIAGYKKTWGGATVDIGALYYVYARKRNAGDATASNFIEPYLSVSGTIGPVTAKGTVNWAPKQKALALDQVGPKRSNVYLAGDLSAAIPSTPLTISGHLGHSIGPSWLATTGRGNNYTDWNIGVSAAFKMLTVGVTYVDTNTTYLTPSGKDAAKGGVFGTVSLSF